MAAKRIKRKKIDPKRDYIARARLDFGELVELREIQAAWMLPEADAIRKAIKIALKQVRYESALARLQEQTERLIAAQKGRIREKSHD